MSDKRTGKKKKQIKPEVKEEVIPGAKVNNPVPKKVKSPQKH